MIDIQLPDGSTITIDTTDPQKAVQAAKLAMQREARAKPDKSNPSYGATRQAIQGATFGFGDEISSAIMTPMEMIKGAITGEDSGKGLLDRAGAAYTRLVEQDRKGMADYEKENPGTAIAANIAGGMTPGGALQKAGMTFLKPGGTVAQRVGQGAAEGAAYGAAYGAGNAEGGMSDRLAGAAESAATGAAFGGALPIATAGIGAVGAPVVNAVRARMDPEGTAARKVAERLGAAGLDPEMAAARIEKAANEGQAMSLADVGGTNARNLLRTATNVPGPGQEKAASILARRQGAQGDRLKQAVEDLFADPNRYAETKDAIKETVKQAAKPLYEQAYKRPIEFTTGLQEIIDTPAGRAALRDAQRLAENAREPFKQFFVQMGDDPNNISITRVPDMRAWDWIKRALDDKIEANTIREPFRAPQMNNEARIINQLKQALVSELDAQNPVYAQARKVWSSGQEADQAIEVGRNVFDMGAKRFKQAMDAMSPQQRELARLGVAEKLRERIDNAGMTHNALLKFFSTREQYNSIRAAFPDDQSFAKFRTAMFNEARMRKTYQAVTGNSTTARQLADLNEAQSPAGTALMEAGLGAATGGTAGMMTSLINTMRGGLSRLGGFTPDVAAKTVDILLSRNPEAVRSIVQRLQDIEASALRADERKTAIRQLVTRALATGAGTVLGPQPASSR